MNRLSLSWRRACAATWVAALGGGCTAILGADHDYHHVDGGGAGGATTTSATISSADATSSVGTGGANPTGLGTAGEPCSSVDQLACAGHAQAQHLICGQGHTWVTIGMCGTGTLCDTSPGTAQGTCQPVVAGCAGKNPGYEFCTATTSSTCGPDLVTIEDTSCPEVCSLGQCVACLPTTTQCAGNQPQLCDGNGAWQDAAPCAAPTPACFAGACAQSSCAGVAPTCGPMGNESCCAGAVVQGGSYDRINNSSFPAKVSDFRLDRFEITVGRFRRFMAAYPGSKPVAGAGAHPLIAGSGWQSSWDAMLAADQAALKAAVTSETVHLALYPDQAWTWTDAPGANENLPMNCLDWYSAFAFCAWDGGRLPTEAEWNYAAAGGSDQRDYPWAPAAAPDMAHAVFNCTGDGSASSSCLVTDILPVGSKSLVGDGKWAQSDLAGNVWEWNLDWNGMLPVPCADCAQVAVGTTRILRGGSWFATAMGILSTGRVSRAPTERDIAFGARCARTP